MATPLYEAVPEGEVRGGVLVVQEAFGVNGHIRDVCDRCAAAGWHTVSPHLFHRTGDPELAYDYQAVLPHMRALAPETVDADLRAALDRLSAGPSGRTGRRPGIVGFCMGGTVAAFAAAALPVSAAVSFYGGGVSEGRFGLPPLLELAPRFAVPWLGLYGEKDHAIPPADIDALELAANSAAVPTELVRYPDAGHGFHCDARPDYRESDARDAWRRTLEFLEHWSGPAAA